MPIANIDAIQKIHPGQDIAITAERLIPRHGWLVEFDHWNSKGPVIHEVCFVRFTDDQGGCEVDGRLITHATALMEGKG